MFLFKGVVYLKLIKGENMSIQIKKKFLRSQSVDGSKVLFLNEDSFKALKVDGSEAALFKLDSDNKFQLLEMPRVSYDPTHANELARKSYVDAGDAAEALARAAADAAEALARAAADAAEQAAREDADSAIRGEFAAADALVLLESKDYTDEKVSEEAAIRSAEDADIRYDFAAADLVEKTAREAADQLLRDDLDSEIATRTSEDARVLSESKLYTDAEKTRAMAAEAAEAELRASEDVRVLSESKTYTNQIVLNEEYRAMVQEAAIRSEFAAADAEIRLGLDELHFDIEQEITTRASEDIRVLSEAKLYTDEEKVRAMAAEQYLQEQIWTEESRAQLAEEALQSEIDAEEELRASEDIRVLGEAKAYTDEEKVRAMAAEAAEALTRESEDARVLSESKAYTDMSIASVIDAAPEAYNTLREIAEYIASDQTATSQILSQLYDHETRLDVIEGTGEGSIAKAESDAMAYTDAEKARAMAAEAGLQSDIDAEESRAMAREAQLQSEIDAEEVRAMAREAQLQSEIDAEELLRASEDVRVLGEAKAYTDVEKARAMAQEAAIRSEFAAADAAIRLDLDDLDGYAQELRFDLDQEIVDRISDVNAEETRAMAAEAAEAALRASEDVRVLGEAKAYTDAEKTRAMAAEAAETAARIAADSAEATLRASEDIRVLGEAKTYTDAEKTRAMGVEALLQSEIDAEELLRASEDIRVLSESKVYTDAEVLAEETRAMAREAQLQYEIDAEEALRASEDSRVLFESKEYTNQKVAAVIDSAPEMLDTLRELAEALGNDENFATSVTGYIAAAKQEAKQYAESLADDFGGRFAVDSFMVSSQTIANNYIELSHKAFSMSIVFSIDRLMMLEGEDYEVSVMNGKTRLTFAGSMLQGEAEALALGDKLRVRYLKDVRS